MITRRCAVLVVGGGPAGVSLAIRLQCAGVPVCLAIMGSSKTSLPAETLPPQAVGELDALDVYAASLACIGNASYGIQASWGSARAVFHSHIVDPPQSRGWHVERTAFHEVLLDTARRHGVLIMAGQFVSAARRHGGWRAVLRSPTQEVIDADFLVDATGRSASVARSVGAVRRRLDALCCISAVIEAERVRSRMLSVEAVPYGWWYIAPLRGARSLVSLVSDIDILRDLGAFKAAAWSALFARTALASDAQVGEVQLHAHPCETAFLNPPCGEQWMAVGDAAATFDPLSSLGVAAALIAGRRAATTVVQSLAGDVGALRRYREQHASFFEQYLQARSRHYTIEARWRSESFWSRRAADISSRLSGAPCGHRFFERPLTLCAGRMELEGEPV